MTLILKTLGMALFAAGLMSTAQAAPVSNSAVIDFDQKPGNPLQTFSDGDVITDEYEQFGVRFTTPNFVRCSKTSDPINCTAPRLIAPPQSGRNFLMNEQRSGFSINVLDGISLSTMKLDIARNSSSFFIKFYGANDAFLSSPSLPGTGSNFDWARDVELAGVSDAVRRIEFGGDIATSFAIDYLRFDYTENAVNVPEPAALSLVALALAGVGLTRRRRA